MSIKIVGLFIILMALIQLLFYYKSSDQRNKYWLSNLLIFSSSFYLISTGASFLSSNVNFFLRLSWAFALTSTSLILLINNMKSANGKIIFVAIILALLVNVFALLFTNGIISSYDSRDALGGVHLTQGRYFFILVALLTFEWGWILKGLLFSSSLSMSTIRNIISVIVIVIMLVLSLIFDIIFPIVGRNQYGYIATLAFSILLIFINNIIMKANPRSTDI